MLTRAVFYGLNVLSLAGLLAMGLGLSIATRVKAGGPAGIVVMAIGTFLVFLGFYLGPR